MTHSARHAAPEPVTNPRATRTVKFWLVPMVISVTVLSALAALYLGGILNPTGNLRHFPIAIVNDDAGPTGKQVVDGIVNGLDAQKFDVRVLSADEAAHQLDTAQVYGQLHIPANFTTQLEQLAQQAAAPGQVQRPVVTISTNQRAGTLGAAIAGTTFSEAMERADKTVGEQLSAQVAQQSGGAQLPAAAVLLLAAPLDIEVSQYNPLPSGTGSGLSAFYFSLLLLLAGFTGSIVISTLVDSQLGYVPAEFGPVYRFATQVNISRFRTLLVKWALVVILALVISTLYQLIARGLGMPVELGWQLWSFSVFTVIAVGVTATSLIAALGSMGLLVNMLIFVILGLPSAGATVPLQATPTFFQWLAKFEPMHQVFLGTRALLYFDGHADAGLSHALVMTTIGLVIGLAIGTVTTLLYDRRGYHRIVAGVPVTPPDERTHPATTEQN